MKNRNIKRMLLFATLCIIFVGVVSAADIESDSAAVDTTDTQTTDTTETVSPTTDNGVTDNTKEIYKEDIIEKPVKNDGDRIKTKISLAGVKNSLIDLYYSVNITLTDENNNRLNYTPITINLNGHDYQSITDYNGFKYWRDKTRYPGTNKINVSFAGNSTHEPSSATASFYASGQAHSYFKLDEIEDTFVGNVITVSGYFYYVNDDPLKKTHMGLNLNGQKVVLITDETGFFSHDFTVTKFGHNGLSAHYPGSSKFREAFYYTSFRADYSTPQDTYIVLDKVDDEVNYGENTVISGHYYYGNNIPLTYTNMRIKINGKVYLTKTDANGFFTYTHKANSVWKNNLQVYYPGNTNFNPTSVTETFYVNMTQKPLETYFKLNDIETLIDNEYPKISGYYYYSDDVPLTYTRVRVDVDGKQVLVKTDNKGYFEYEYETNKEGPINVTVSYDGNEYFLKASTSKTFNLEWIECYDTRIPTTDIKDTYFNGFVRFNGVLLYGNNNPIAHTNLTLNINGEEKTIQTGYDGSFMYSYYADKVWDNKITVSYPGTKYFKNSSVTKTFYVRINSPIRTYFRLNDIKPVKNGKNITISGYCNYGWEKPLTYTNMKLNINGQELQLKTDDKGYFSYNYNTSQTGINNVTASFDGTKNFQESSLSQTFIVRD